MLLYAPICWGCARPARGREPLCASCRGRLRFLEARPSTLSGVMVWAAVAFEGPARDLVHALKFRSAVALADPMAALMVASAPPELLAGALVPVPLQRWRERRRGANQARLLAAAVGRRSGLAVADALVRRGSGARQVGRGRGARLAGPAGSVSARAPAVPERALIVDDVVTTGATLAACAAALRGAGCVEVAGLAFARTSGR